MVTAAGAEEADEEEDEEEEEQDAGADKKPVKKTKPTEKKPDGAVTELDARPDGYKRKTFFLDDETAGPQNGKAVPEENWAKEEFESFETAPGRLILRNKTTGDSWRCVIGAGARRRTRRSVRRRRKRRRSPRRRASPARPPRLTVPSRCSWRLSGPCGRE